MHHDEHDPRHIHYRAQHRRREQHPNHAREDNFNDFRSRWGEPSPYIHLNHQEEWQHGDVGRFEDQGRYHREEWLPNQRRQHQHRQGEQQHYQEPVWRQRDIHFDSSNQRVEDRWYEDPLLPHPESRRRKRDPRDAYWHERNRE
ncbi:hypothetical protein ACSX1A_18640 [Pontibacter sp. MBLB2868]|uniref:hypothetical protein n=1 Tax=Pontibacter sp. MBLB2868 TaxID=3451555 RepID=UPI003F74B312